tara:strand:+ start:1105 stop:1560 length:456 start_codon:yes stop_codon:yes gene_type:complete
MARYDLHHAKSPLEVSIVTGQGAEVVEFIAKGTIAAGDWVDLDAAGSTTGADRVDGVVPGTGCGLCIGVALEAASAASAGDPPNMVRVCVSGYVEGAKTDGSAAIPGDTLVPQSSAAVQKAAPTNTNPAVAIALESDESGTTCDVYVIRRF